MEVICDSCCMPIENHAGNFKWNGEPICEGCHEAGCGEFQCPHCDAVVDYTLHQKGKAECCKYCVDCKEYKASGEGWWTHDEDGDHCEECSPGTCDECGEETKDDDLYETEFEHVTEMLCKDCVSTSKGHSVRWEEEKSDDDE